MIECERRKHGRWAAVPDVMLEYRFVRRFSILHGKYRTFGRVVDLSLGGIAVEYRDRDLRPVDRIEYALTVSGGDVRLEGLEMLPVSDFVVAENCGPEDPVCRRRSFRFVKMSPVQQEVIRLILQKYTTGAAAPVGDER